jgi:hypothetical protein
MSLLVSGGEVGCGTWQGGRGTSRQFILFMRFELRQIMQVEVENGLGNKA